MIESIVLAQTYGGRSGGFLKTVTKPGPSATIERQAGMEIFTSYYGRTKQLRKAGIEPVAISRGVPKWYDGASYQALAPTWAMMHMTLDQYWEQYWRILSGLEPNFILGEILQTVSVDANGIALVCYEKNPDECHRSAVAKWLNEAGYDVREWEPPAPRRAVSLTGQMALF